MSQMWTHHSRNLRCQWKMTLHWQSLSPVCFSWKTEGICGKDVLVQKRGLSTRFGGSCHLQPDRPPSRKAAAELWSSATAGLTSAPCSEGAVTSGSYRCARPPAGGSRGSARRSTSGTCTRTWWFGWPATCRNPDRSTSPHSCPRRGTSGYTPVLRSPTTLKTEKISEVHVFCLFMF